MGRPSKSSREKAAIRHKQRWQLKIQEKELEINDLKLEIQEKEKEIQKLKTFIEETVKELTAEEKTAQVHVQESQHAPRLAFKNMDEYFKYEKEQREKGKYLLFLIF